MGFGFEIAVAERDMAVRYHGAVGIGRIERQVPRQTTDDSVFQLSRPADI